MQRKGFASAKGANNKLFGVLSAWSTVRVALSIRLEYDPSFIEYGYGVVFDTRRNALIIRVTLSETIEVKHATSRC